MNSQPEHPDLTHHELADIGQEELDELREEVAWLRERLDARRGGAEPHLRAC